METLSYKKVVSRKEHKCNFCGQPIIKGTVYDKQAVKDGGIYTWKSHAQCGELASELKWYDECNDGLSQDAFYECVTESYAQLMSDKFNEEWESKDFKMPDFIGKLNFLKDYFLNG